MVYFFIFNRTMVKSRLNKITLIATLNVLFDHRQKHILFSKERYLNIITLVQNLNADIVGFTEVTENFLKFLKNDDFIKNNYNIFGWTPDCDHKDGNVLISKIKFSKTYMKKLENLNRTLAVGEIKINDSKIIICCTHLTAGPHSWENRELELEEIYETFEKEESTIILLGDFNFVYESEELYIKNEYTDVWKELRPNEDGFTFDSQNNFMIYEKLPIVPIKWQKRFDRILIKNNSKNLKLTPTAIDLWANKQVYINSFEIDKFYLSKLKYNYLSYYLKCFLRSTTSVLFDIFGMNLWRNKSW
jgi:endonuclease/exonuclease/phosphatase family metal-dependent hydrolase